MAKVVQAFWRGPIRTMEKMCLNSHLKVGHTVRLYSYGDSMTNIEHVPKGVELCYAGDILPEERVNWFPALAPFADYFRYQLLLQKGGWWADMDVLCLKPFDIEEDYVFASDNIDHLYINSFVLKAPVNAPILVDACNWIEGMTQEERDKMGYMDIGPNLIQQLVPAFKLDEYVQGPSMFDPVPYMQIVDTVMPEKTAELEAACKDSYCIHLRQSIWDYGANCCAGILPWKDHSQNRDKITTDEKYDDNCLWEKLKRELL